MKGLTMRKIRAALRRHASGLSTRKIATSLGVGQSTASEYLKPIERAALSWPLAPEITDAGLEALWFHPVGGVSRPVDLFDQVERSALRPLPAEPCVFCEWKQCTVGLDYHVEVDKHYYSVP